MESADTLAAQGQRWRLHDGSRRVGRSTCGQRRTSRRSSMVDLLIFCPINYSSRQSFIRQSLSGRRFLDHQRSCHGRAGRGIGRCPSSVIARIQQDGKNEQLLSPRGTRRRRYGVTRTYRLAPVRRVRLSDAGGTATREWVQWCRRCARYCDGRSPRHSTGWGE